MAKLKFICISDTHLGEPTSLLNYTKGLNAFKEQLRIIAPDGVERFVLAGDITDKVLASRKQIREKCHAFFRAVNEALSGKIDKFIFLFGNHDLNLFRENFCDNTFNSKFFVSDINTEKNPAGEKIRGLLMPEDVKTPLYVANPIYVTQGKKKTYVFHHGHHVRKDVYRGVLKILQYTDLAKATLGHKISWGKPNPRKAKSLEDFENGTFELVCTFWQNKADKPIPKEEKWWRLFHFISRPDNKKKSTVSGALKVSNLKKHWKKGLGGYGRRVVFKKYLPALFESQLVQMNNKKNISFVYGDTHKAAYEKKEIKIKSAKYQVKVFNTGNWTTQDNAKHPDCYMYVVDENEKETMWECCFSKEYIEDFVAPKVRNLSRKIIKKESIDFIKKLFGN